MQYRTGLKCGAFFAVLVNSNSNLRNTGITSKLVTLCFEIGYGPVLITNFLNSIDKR